MPPKRVLLHHSAADSRPPHPSQTPQGSVNESAEDIPPPRLPSLNICSATHDITPCEVSGRNLSGQRFSTENLSEDFEEISMGNLVLGICSRSKKIKKDVLPKPPRKRRRRRQASTKDSTEERQSSEEQPLPIPRRIKTRQKQGEELEYQNLKKSIQKKAVNFLAHILQTQNIKSDGFKKKRYLSSCLQVAIWKIQNHFTKQICQEIRDNYFNWLDEKMKYEQKLWIEKRDPISKRTIQIYKLARESYELFTQGQWVESIERFFDNPDQQSKLKGNIIFFLEELLLFDDAAQQAPQRKPNLKKKSLKQVKEILKKVQSLTFSTANDRIEEQVNQDNSQETIETELDENELSVAVCRSAIQVGDEYQNQPHQSNQRERRESWQDYLDLESSNRHD